MGQIAAQQAEGAKKLFAITADGRAELNAQADAVEALVARLAAIGEERQRTDSASVRRAMGNLRQVLMNRLGGRDIDEATLHQLVALIDEAAQKIERLKGAWHMTGSATERKSVVWGKSGAVRVDLGGGRTIK